MKISKIYLIDDDEVFALKFLNDLQKNTDYKIYHFGSVETGLEYAKLDLPEVVFLDHVLNGQNGIDSIPKWKSINPKINIIVVSSTKDPDNLRKALKFEVTGFLNKDVYLKDEANKFLQELEKTTNFNNFLKLFKGGRL